MGWGQKPSHSGDHASTYSLYPLLARRAYLCSIKSIICAFGLASAVLPPAVSALRIARYCLKSSNNCRGRCFHPPTKTGIHINSSIVKMKKKNLIKRRHLPWLSTSDMIPTAPAFSTARRLPSSVLVQGHLIRKTWAESGANRRRWSAQRPALPGESLSLPPPTRILATRKPKRLPYGDVVMDAGSDELCSRHLHSQGRPYMTEGKAPPLPTA